MWWTLLLACAEGPGKGGPGAPVDSAVTAAPVDSAAPAVEPPRLVDGPVLVSGGDDAPLTAWLELTTDVPTAVAATLVGPDGEVFERAWPEVATTHRHPVLALLPETPFVATITATSDGGAVTADVTHTTAPLPFPWPTLQVLAHHPDRMQPGLTLVPLQAGEQDQFVAAFDRDLRWRHVLRITGKVNDVRLHDDTLWMIAGSAVEHRAVDGTVHTRWHAGLDSDTDVHVDVLGEFHHEVVPLDTGFLALARTRRVVPDYPDQDDPLGPGREVEVLVPRVVEVGFDGTIMADLDLGEALSLRRIGYGSNNATRMGMDWGHANAVVPDGPDHWIVSLRHQDTVVRVGRDGAVDWILANHDGWPDHLVPHLLTPVGDVRFPFHQHAPERLADGGLAVFDNGNFRFTPYGDPPGEPAQWSRLVIYDIDPVARTVTQRWAIDQSATTGRLFSWAMGDADLLPNGNLLGVYGHLSTEAGVDNRIFGRGDVHARLIEVALDDPGAPALDIRLSSRHAVLPEGWRVYRAQRVDRLHSSIRD